MHFIISMFVFVILRGTFYNIFFQQCPYHKPLKNFKLNISHLIIIFFCAQAEQLNLK